MRCPPRNRGPAWRTPVTGRLISALAALFPGTAEAACRLALVLALDVSGSVDESEYVLQMNGIAAALEKSEVREAILAFPESPMALAIFEWSASSYQREVLDWTMLEDVQALDAVIARLRGWRRAPGPEATGLGAALRHAGGRLAAGPDCWRRVIDVSGDGRNNDWPMPRHVRKEPLLAGVTINALVVGDERPYPGDSRLDHILELSEYFAQRIIQGPDAFVETAEGYEDYAQAMERKLLREISSPPMGALPQDAVKLAANWPR